MKRVLITGASGGIGAAIARKFALQKNHVILHANKNAAKVESLAEEIRLAGGSAETVVFDVCDRAACHLAIDTILADGAVDVLVNNAGIHADAAFPAMREDQWRNVLDVSLNGFFNVTQPLVMPMVRQRRGRIISLSSVAGVTGNRGQVNYAAAKSGIHAATKSLALELASRQITVNVVAPGVIATEMSAGQFDDASIKKLVPMQRTGKPEEVANLVVFLASDEAAYITGQVISINGGMA
jgi:3-oxoacyl-[acyl-carrier protein] reductase